MQSPALNSGEIHVWTATLAVPAEMIARHRKLLADEEKARAERFLVPRVRERFTVARAILRRLLSGYVGSAPETLCFGYADHGKPYLAHHSGLRFNLSHAGDAALIAIALQREIGIDIEAATREVDVLGVARKVFSPDEYARLTALAPQERPAAFFRLWTRKEAYIKARGEGFGYPTRSFSVSHLPGDQDALLADARKGIAPDDWRIIEIAAPDGFRAALAAPGRDWSVLRFDVSTICYPSIPAPTRHP
jgi:4'-phosphopantetheinyl transferase